MALRSSSTSAAWTAAPSATAWSGLAPASGGRPDMRSIQSRTIAMRVEPPTGSTPSISLQVRPASASACSVSWPVRSSRSRLISSNSALVTVRRVLCPPATRRISAL
jgi:hypothetical protein